MKGTLSKAKDQCVCQMLRKMAEIILELEIIGGLQGNRKEKRAWRTSCASMGRRRSSRHTVCHTVHFLGQACRKWSRESELDRQTGQVSDSKTERRRACRRSRVGSCLHRARYQEFRNWWGILSFQKLRQTLRWREASWMSKGSGGNVMGSYDLPKVFPRKLKEAFGGQSVTGQESR